jgi:hypothetical protein
MKNKTKKIIAGLGLALVGGATLTGCSMTEAQQKALDKVVEKTDEIIELVANNMTMQNAKLTKEEAAEKIMLARNYFLSKNLNVKMQMEQKFYETFYGNTVLEDSICNYQINDVNCIRGMSENSNGKNYFKNDYKNEVCYKYREVGESKNFEINEPYDYDPLFSALSFDLVTACSLETVTPDMIVGLETIEGGYNFSIFYHRTDKINSAERIKVELTIVNERFTAFDIELIRLKNGELESSKFESLTAEQVFTIFAQQGRHIDVQVHTYAGTYEYDLDTKDIDAKFAQIESEYLAD